MNGNQLMQYGPKQLSILLLLTALTPLPAIAALPDSSLNLKLAAPIDTWDEAVPLGNGTMGMLLWGKENTIRLSLDRGDLWDERPWKEFPKVKSRFTWAEMQRMVSENKLDELNEVFNAIYDCNCPPTKLPAGRVEITLDPSQSVDAFELNLATA